MRKAPWKEKYFKKLKSVRKAISTAKSRGFVVPEDINDLLYYEAKGGYKQAYNRISGMNLDYIKRHSQILLPEVGYVSGGRAMNIARAEHAKTLKTYKNILREGTWAPSKYYVVKPNDVLLQLHQHAVQSMYWNYTNDSIFDVSTETEDDDYDLPPMTPSNGKWMTDEELDEYQSYLINMGSDSTDSMAQTLKEIQAVDVSEAEEESDHFEYTDEELQLLYNEHNYYEDEQEPLSPKEKLEKDIAEWTESPLRAELEELYKDTFEAVTGQAPDYIPYIPMNATEKTIMDMLDSTMGDTLSKEDVQMDTFFQANDLINSFDNRELKYRARKALADALSDDKESLLGKLQDASTEMVESLQQGAHIKYKGTSVDDDEEASLWLDEWIDFVRD